MREREHPAHHRPTPGQKDPAQEKRPPDGPVGSIAAGQAINDKKGRIMTDGLETDEENTGEYPVELLNTIPNGTIFSYNLDDGKTPGGLKVRWKIRIATGTEGARWDARQAEAIKELLQWAHRHQHSRPTR